MSFNLKKRSASKSLDDELIYLATAGRAAASSVLKSYLYPFTPAVLGLRLRAGQKESRGSKMTERLADVTALTVGSVVLES